MRLINVHTLEMRTFFDVEIPPYAILSHRWGRDEVSLKEFKKGLKLESAGYKKILGFRDFVLSRSFVSWKRNFRRTPPFDWYELECDPIDVKWIWIDTCCIDQRSSAELSESINSMSKWYRKAEVCVVHLADVIRDDKQRTLAQSEWFQRGWTLQELLAPNVAIFCDQGWQVVGHKCRQDGSYISNRPCLCNSELIPLDMGSNLNEQISKITGIGEQFLYEADEVIGDGTACIAEKMSWAAGRRTTRIEDTAYCLLGLFQVNMPLLYGEGGRAFFRLQEEIIRQSDDQSVFAFELDSEHFAGFVPCLADSPERFKRCSNIIKYPFKSVWPYNYNQKILHMETDVQVARNDRTAYGMDIYIIKLNCTRVDAKLKSLFMIELALTVSQSNKKRIQIDADESDDSSFDPQIFWRLNFRLAFNDDRPLREIIPENTRQDLGRMSLLISNRGDGD